MPPAVSVVIPTYNAGEFLTQALESVFAQTLPPTEVIVVDDASPDDTPARVERLASAAPLPVRLIRLDKNSGGPARPLNVGIGAARGEFVAGLDQDDVFTPAKLEEEVLPLARDPGLAFVCGWCGHYEEPGRNFLPPELLSALAAAAEPREGYSHLDRRAALRLLMEYGNFARGYPGFVFRRRDWEKKGGLDEGFTIGSDYDFVCWLGTQGAVGFVPRVHYLRRVHAGNLVRRRVVTHTELTRIRARYLTREPWLLEDRPLAEKLKAEMTSCAYWFRRAHYYRLAHEVYRLYGRVWGWDLRLLTAVAKLPLQWAWDRIARRPPVHSGWTRFEPQVV